MDAVLLHVSGGQQDRQGGADGHYAEADHEERDHTHSRANHLRLDVRRADGHHPQVATDVLAKRRQHLS